MSQNVKELAICKNVLYVSGLPQNITDEDLQQIFGKYGTVMSINYPESSNKHRLSVYIEYQQEEHAVAARKDIHGTKVHDQRIFVDYAPSNFHNFINNPSEHKFSPHIKERIIKLDESKTQYREDDRKITEDLNTNGRFEELRDHNTTIASALPSLKTETTYYKASRPSIGSNVCDRIEKLGSNKEKNPEISSLPGRSDRNEKAHTSTNITDKVYDSRGLTSSFGTFDPKLAYYDDTQRKNFLIVQKQNSGKLEDKENAHSSSLKHLDIKLEDPLSTLDRKEMDDEEAQKLGDNTEFTSLFKSYGVDKIQQLYPQLTDTLSTNPALLLVEFTKITKQLDELKESQKMLEQQRNYTAGEYNDTTRASKDASLTKKSFRSKNSKSKSRTRGQSKNNGIRHVDKSRSRSKSKSYRERHYNNKAVTNRYRSRSRSRDSRAISGYTKRRSRSHSKGVKSHSHEHERHRERSSRLRGRDRDRSKSRVRGRNSAKSTHGTLNHYRNRYPRGGRSRSRSRHSSHKRYNYSKSSRYRSRSHTRSRNHPRQERPNKPHGVSHRFLRPTNYRRKNEDKRNYLKEIGNSNYDKNDGSRGDNENKDDKKLMDRGSPERVRDKLEGYTDYSKGSLRNSTSQDPSAPSIQAIKNSYDLPKAPSRLNLKKGSEESSDMHHYSKQPSFDFPFYLNSNTKQFTGGFISNGIPSASVNPTVHAIANAPIMTVEEYCKSINKPSHDSFGVHGNSASENGFDKYRMIDTASGLNPVNYMSPCYDENGNYTNAYYYNNNPVINMNTQAPNPIDYYNQNKSSGSVVLNKNIASESEAVGVLYNGTSTSVSNLYNPKPGVMEEESSLKVGERSSEVHSGNSGILNSNIKENNEDSQDKKDENNEIGKAKMEEEKPANTTPQIAPLVNADLIKKLNLENIVKYMLENGGNIASLKKKLNMPNA